MGPFDAYSTVIPESVSLRRGSQKGDVGVIRGSTLRGALRGSEH